MIRTVFVATSLVLAVIFLLPLLVLWSLIAGNPDLMYGLAMKLVRLETRLLGIRVRVEGVDKVPSGPCIFVANHASSIDPMAFIPAIPRRVGILAKQELFRIPIFGTAMRVAEFVPVDRGNKESASAAASLAVQRLKKGLSFVIFSEGTRSPDGRMRPFKRGAFTLAIEAGIPVVPVSIVGAHRLMKKGEKIVRRGSVTIRFAEPIDASAFTFEQRDELLARVQNAVAAGLPPDQQPL